MEAADTADISQRATAGCRRSLTQNRRWNSGPTLGRGQLDLVVEQLAGQLGGRLVALAPVASVAMQRCGGHMYRHDTSSVPSSHRASRASTDPKESARPVPGGAVNTAFPGTSWYPVPGSTGSRRNAGHVTAPARRCAAPGLRGGVARLIGLCVALWIRAKTVDQDERGNAERRALFVGLWPPMFWLIGDSLRRHE